MAIGTRGLRLRRSRRRLASLDTLTTVMLVCIEGTHGDRPHPLFYTSSLYPSGQIKASLLLASGLGNFSGVGGRGGHISTRPIAKEPWQHRSETGHTAESQYATTISKMMSSHSLHLVKDCLLFLSKLFLGKNAFVF